MNQNLKYSLITLSILGVFVGVFVYNLTKHTDPGENMPLLASPQTDDKMQIPSISPVSATAPEQKQEPLLSNQSKSMHIVTIETNKGEIQFETYDNDAPKTVENFITLAQKNFYNGVIFHRVIKGFMIQGGDPTGTGTGGPGYKFGDELNPNTESYKQGYKKGVVAMANAGPNTNGSQFFIMLADYPLPNNYTIFGKVIKGQDIVDAIGNTPTGSNDKPISDIVMKKVTVTKK